MIEPIWLGRDQELFGLYLPPGAGHELDTGVVFVHPIGQEYIRTSATLVTLGRKLSQLGFHSLRFDLYGCGDSKGSLEEVLWDDWMGNLVNVIKEFKQSIGFSKVVVIGIRMGATLAASHAMRHALDGLVLWSPIFDGSTYLEELRRRDENYHAGTFSKNPHENELLGFVFGQRMLDQISQITPRTFQQDLKCQHIFLMDQENNIMPSVIKENESSRILFKRTQSGVFWEKRSDDHQQVLVPSKDITEVVNFLQETFMTYV